MGHKVKFLKTYKTLLEELIKIQQDLQSAEAERNEFLIRMFQIDAARLRERLKIQPCELCYYGKLVLQPNMCQYWDKCGSTAKVVNMWDETDCVAVELVLDFHLNG